MAYQYLDLLTIITEIDFNDQAQIRNLFLRVRKNFDELQAVVTILQAYENNTGVPINEDVNETSRYGTGLGVSMRMGHSQQKN